MATTLAIALACATATPVADAAPRAGTAGRAARARAGLEAKKKRAGELRRKASAFYFKEHRFEKGGRVYRALGAGVFSKYWINGGGHWTRRRPDLRLSKGNTRIERRRDYIARSRRLEGIHLMMTPVYGGIALHQLAAGKVVTAAIAAGLNAIVNGYPIMSMRMNRNRKARELQALEAAGSEQARKTGRSRAGRAH